MNVVQQNALTIVLATVFVAGWRVAWAHSLASLILGAYTSCSKLRMYAVKGGPATDCEVDFVEAFMDEVGAKTVTDKQDNGSNLSWSWDLARDGAPCRIVLVQFKTAEAINVKAVAWGLMPQRATVARPKLNRAAVISSPVKDLCPTCTAKTAAGGGFEVNCKMCADMPRVDEQMNAALNKAFDMVSGLAKEIGFWGTETKAKWDSRMDEEVAKLR